MSELEGQEQVLEQNEGLDAGGGGEPSEGEVSQEIVDRARSMGWIPKDEFRGDESRWRPADEYVDRAENLMPILKSQLGKYEEKIGKYESEITNLKSSLDSQKKTTEKLVKMSDNIRQQEYERARREITKQQAQAVADGDVETWQTLEDKKEKLEKPEVVAMEPPAPESQAPPAFHQWHQTNDWYAKDQDLTIFADAFGASLKQQNPNLAYEQVLAQVEAKVKSAFPQKFSNPNRSQPGAVDGGAQRTATTQTNRKSYNNLPADAKAQCDAFIAQGVIPNREQYVKDYYDLEA